MPLDLPELDRSSSLSLAQQIAEHFAAAIRHGHFGPGDRLPTIRGVAERVGVTRSTVQEAYRQLTASGLTSGAVGRGTTVAATESDSAGQPLSPFASAALRQLQDSPRNLEVRPGQRIVADFAHLQPDDEAFPVGDLRRALDAVLGDGGGRLLNYGHPTGLPDLRECLAERERAHDPNVTAEHVLITSGAQQAMDLVLRTFTSPGDVVAVPVPSYQQLFGLFKSHGVALEPVRSGADGPDLDDLRRALAVRHVRLLCLMPTFHNPTGATLDVAQRQALMDVVAETRVPVLEDEYERPLRFAGEALPTLRSMDPRGLTVTVHTFSKGLFPGIRIGWAHADPAVLAPMAAVKRFMDLETSPLLQAGLCELVRSGAFDRYLVDLRAELARRHAAAGAALAEHVPGARWSEPDGGFALWVEFEGEGAGDRVAQRAAERGVMVTPGRVFDPLGRPSRGFRLSLSRAPTDVIERGIQILGQAARDVLSPSPQDQPPLFL